MVRKMLLRAKGVNWRNGRKILNGFIERIEVRAALGEALGTSVGLRTLNERSPDIKRQVRIEYTVDGEKMLLRSDNRVELSGGKMLVVSRSAMLQGVMAIINNLVLGLIKQQHFDYAPQARRFYNAHLQDAIDSVLYFVYRANGYPVTCPHPLSSGRVNRWQVPAL